MMNKRITALNAVASSTKATAFALENETHERIELIIKYLAGILFA